MNKIRLQVALAKAGVASRRKAALIIGSNRVEVNGKAVNQKGFRVDIHKDIIVFDGKAVSFGGARRYYILNKPRGVVSTAADERGRKTVSDCVHHKGDRLYPIGRLDKDTTGLIILTNDGDLTYRLTHPKFEVARVYEAKVGGKVKVEDSRRLKSGINIEGKRARAQKVILKKSSTNFSILHLTLREGRKRQVRYMFEAIGHPVLKLKRISYGPMKLGRLTEGESRMLTAEELAKLKSAVGIS